MIRVKLCILKYILKLWRFKKMTKSTMKVVKGVTAGIAAGVVMGYIGKQMSHDKRHMKKKANRAIETMNDMMDTVSYIFR